MGPYLIHIALLLILAMGVVAFVYFQRASAERQLVRHSEHVIESVELWIAEIHEAESAGNQADHDADDREQD